jgi:hypothetical protein
LAGAWRDERGREQRRKHRSHDGFPHCVPLPLACFPLGAWTTNWCNHHASGVMVEIALLSRSTTVESAEIAAAIM